MTDKLSGIKLWNHTQWPKRLNKQVKLLLDARNLEGFECQVKEFGHHYKGSKDLIILGPP